MRTERHNKNNTTNKRKEKITPFGGGTGEAEGEYGGRAQLYLYTFFLFVYNFHIK